MAVYLPPPSMAITLITQIYKHPSLTLEAFIDYVETVHLPLERSLLGDAFPPTRRIYVDNAVATVRGVAPALSDSRPDLVIETIFENQAAQDRLKAAWEKEGVMKRILDDEESFCREGMGKNTMLVREVKAG